MAVRPLVVAFDVNETVVSLQGLGDRLDELGAPARTLELWFSRVLKDGFALTAAGDYAPFRELALSSLTALLDGDTGKAEHVLQAFATLDPYPDVRPTMQRLQDAGVRMVTLTNGHADTTEAIFRRAGLAPFVERYFDVEGAGRWKPAPEPYRYCARECGVEPAQLALVAVHSWDIHGAHRAGLTTGYATRLEGARMPAYSAADVVADDLIGVADGLLALPAG